MFGYVVVNKPELKIKDFDRYQEYYCGLCHALKERHGVAAQMSLSYDATFATVLLTSLYEPITLAQKKRCLRHPAEKRTYLQNFFIDYVADMNLVLTYYKCLDDWVDEKKVTRLSYSKAIVNGVKKIKSKYPKKVKVIRGKLAELQNLEKQGVYDIDVLSRTFGDIMAEIFDISPKECNVNGIYGDEWKQDLRKLGFLLGKYIYIIDAYDDVEKDIEKGSFNPFIDRFNNSKLIMDAKTSEEKQEFDVWVRDLLMLIATDLAGVYEKLPIIEDVAILRNIIYSGIWTKYFSICERRNKK
ncbi:MAG: hypothetical protein E7259_10050 [Lachnospiraceae bacterium]|nr:hypothetical protein [Lachnospiraceae bacterium]